MTEEQRATLVELVDDRIRDIEDMIDDLRAEGCDVDGDLANLRRLRDLLVEDQELRTR